MSRSPLTLASLAGLLALAPAPVVAAPALNPHVSSSYNRAGCAACHKGHGVSRSSMLSGPLKVLCTDCHGSQAGVDRAIAASTLAPGVKPPLLSSALAQPFVHPMTADAVSSEEAGKVTCTSCHSAHRSMPVGRRGSGDPTGNPNASTKDPQQLEYALCEDCHGSAGQTTQNRTDISRLFNPANRSFHPVEGSANSRSASVVKTLVGRQINCTDCHGNDDAAGPKGPHGSRTRFLLRASYSIADGSAESAQTFGLCYTCHDRNVILASVAFPPHKKHIVDLKASCATCHNPHGAVNNRAMIRFGEETTISGVTPSAKAGKVAYVSTGTGSGSCYLTCHGEDHGPLSYGTAASMKAKVGRHSLIRPEVEQGPGMGVRRRQAQPADPPKGQKLPD